MKKPVINIGAMIMMTVYWLILAIFGCMLMYYTNMHYKIAAMHVIVL